MWNKELPEIKIAKDTGYAYFIDKDHPLATGNSSRVYLHRHIASIKVGFWLTADLHVHHIDENKLNNATDNLLVLSNKEHQLLHSNCINLICSVCNIEFRQLSSKQKFCSKKCSDNSRIKDKEITKELLNMLIPITTWTDLGKMFGYSDNGIKKRAKALGCNINKKRAV